MKKLAIWKKIILAVLGIVLGAALLFGIWILVLTAKEYRPEEIEHIDVKGNYSKTLEVGDKISVLTWNVGYGALGDNADFFMDGGSHVSTASRERVQENMKDIAATVTELSPDIAFFQEVDIDSKRSHHIDEAQTIAASLTGYQEAYATNYECLYVPYPIPAIGKVSGGLLSFSNFEVKEAHRRRLPCPFSWPVRVANLKRCLLVERLPIENSDKELVVINLHLEAYDDGEGKEMQTAILKEVLETEVENGNYVIAGGDFNQVFSNVDCSAYPLVSEELWAPGYIDANQFPDHFVFVADNRNPTCRSLDRVYEGADKETFQFYLIDGFIVSTNLEVNSIETIQKDFVSSDHNPVLMSLTIKAEE